MKESFKEKILQDAKECDLLKKKYTKSDLILFAYLWRDNPDLTGNEAIKMYDEKIGKK